MEIMKLKPQGKDYLWGGTRLREEYGKNIPLTPLAETWECSAHPDGLSVVSNGEQQGKTLADVLSEHAELMGTKHSGRKEFPILVKFIDAQKDLSIQVHPNDEYAQEYEHQNGKTEMWYVLDATEDASLIYGFERNVTKEMLQKAMKDGSLGEYLHKIKVKKGDTYYVPAGMVHGIGAGTLVAEIQESSNVTYRVYDYDRLDKNGNKRELHFEQALQVMNMDSVHGVEKRKNIKYEPGCIRENICTCKYFQTEKVMVKTECKFYVNGTSFQVILCISGHGAVSWEENNLVFDKGDCMFIPAGIGECKIEGKTEFLKIRC